MKVLSSLVLAFGACSALHVPLPASKPGRTRWIATSIPVGGLASLPTAAGAIDFDTLSSYGSKPLIMVDGYGGFEINPCLYLIIALIGGYQYLPKPERKKPEETDAAEIVEEIEIVEEVSPSDGASRSGSIKMMAGKGETDGPSGLAAFAQSIAKAARPPPNPPLPSKQEQEDFESQPPSIGKLFQGFAMKTRYRRLEATEQSYGTSKGKKK